MKLTVKCSTGAIIKKCRPRAKVDSRLRGSRFEQKLQFYALFTENWIITSSREAEIAESEVFLFCSQ